LIFRTYEVKLGDFGISIIIDPDDYEIKYSLLGYSYIKDEYKLLSDKGVGLTKY
jgi:hypothetical protein